MTPAELKQIRRILFLSASEAAKWIGNCETRSWQRWENGSRPIPESIIQNVGMIALSRAELLMLDPAEDDPMYRYYERYEDFHKATGASELKWRLAQSVSAELVSEKYATQWNNEEIITE